MSLQQKKLMFDLRGYFLVAIVAAWLVGILLVSMFVLPSLVLLASAGIFGLLIIVFYQDRQMRFVMLLAFCACLGAWRYSAALPSNDPYSITPFIGTGSLEVSGTVADEPQVESRTRLLLVDVSEVSQDDGNNWKEADGQVQVETLDTSLEDPYGADYGDSVELRGKLQPPSPDSPPGILASMQFPSVSVTDTGGNPIIAFLYHLRATFATVIEQALPQPEAAILIAIVLGLQTPGLQSLTSIPNLTSTGYLSLKSAFSLTGTIHLTVSSGFKVTILAGLVASSARIFYRRRKAHLLLA